MAKTTTMNSESLDVGIINLSRLLANLERTILSTDSDPELRRSSYERTRVGANLEYARSLLLRLEHDSASIKVQSRKQIIQSDLQHKRDLVKQLNQRLYELDQLSDIADNDSTSASEDDEAILPSYAPAVRDTANSIDTESGDRQGDNTALHAAAANLASTLRSRHQNPNSSTPATTGVTTGTSLFPPSDQPPSSDANLAQTETLLSHNRTEQEDLTTSLLSMARALKSQSLQFQSSLEGSDKEALARAAEGLDKSSEGMEAAGKRMGTLRRMTEGRGWWGRMLMYAWIAGLWLVAFLIVFLLPKLRF